MRLVRFIFRLVLSAAIVFFLIGCGDSDDDNDNNIPADSAEEATFRILITNITANQPFSEQAIIFHGNGYMAWEVGFPASLSLEILAESGDPFNLLLNADQNPDVFRVSRGNAVIFPGETRILVIDVRFAEPLLLTVAAKLVNTNDAFTGVNGEPVGQLEPGQSAVFLAPAFDAGTEFNDESALSLPGPSFGGTGFDPIRDDSGFITIHPGVITFQDGLADSVLDFSNRFDNPVMRLVVARIE